MLQIVNALLEDTDTYDIIDKRVVDADGENRKPNQL